MRHFPDNPEVSGIVRIRIAVKGLLCLIHTLRAYKITDVVIPRELKLQQLLIELQGESIIFQAIR